MSLLNLRISSRLYGGFGALVVFGLALAAFAVWQLNQISTQVSSLTLQSTNTIQVEEIATELQAIRRALLRYEFDHDEKAMSEAERRLTTVSGALDLAGKTTASDEWRAAFRDVANKVEEMKTKRIALVEAGKQMMAGRDVLLTDGDKMGDDVQRFVDATSDTGFDHAASALESKISQVRVANWRFQATRDPKRVAIFKANAGKAQERIAELEKANLPDNLASLLAAIKADMSKYSDAFEKTSSNLLLGDEIYLKTLAPMTVSAVERLDAVKESVAQALKKTTADTEGRIASTITIQEVVTGATTLLG